ncbi:carbohydrate-binding module family 20 domain-containing protein [Nostoc sp.]|uniref:carbohydrate-binding module family 20 domain-containing protein n=1 Tax=Nostoc sp. TaxID=1180 RepID=UPI002FF75B9C
MYRFQISAYTQTGESIGIVGSTPELGLWDITKCIHLRTSGDRYPLWWTNIDIQISGDGQKVEYKYVRLDATGNATWESLLDTNRWIPIDSNDCASTIIVDDGAFGYLQPYPFGYIENPAVRIPLDEESQGLKIVVIGSSVALGHKAWFLQGWVWLLAQALQQKYGHKLVNVSEVGANVSRTIARFPWFVTPEKPDIVIIALSLGNEGLAYCPPHERRAVQRRFESGLQQLVKMTRDIGAIPILGGVYPNGDYSLEHYRLIRDTHKRMLSWGVTVLDWLAVVDDGQGRWKAGTSFDPSHPNTVGHNLMYQQIDHHLFDINKDALAKEKQRFQQPNEFPIYFDNGGFHVCVCMEEKHLRIVNSSQYSYTIAPYWQELQTALQSKAGLISGIYIAKNAQPGTLPFLAVEDGAIATTINIPPNTDLEYSPAFNLFSPNNVLFSDGHLGILQADERHLWIINESDSEYNIQPMWTEVCNALKAMPSGVYEDPLYPDAPFRTMMIGTGV